MLGSIFTQMQSTVPPVRIVRPSSGRDQDWYSANIVHKRRDICTQYIRLVVSNAPVCTPLKQTAHTCANV
jgi:hypothetical protein